jgi:hypothetical protein
MLRTTMLDVSRALAPMAQIQSIWQRVAEDFAPFDVDVTTEAPALSALTRASSSDTVFGMTVRSLASALSSSCK